MSGDGMLAVDFRLPNPKPLNREFIELMWNKVPEEKREKEREEGLFFQQECGITATTPDCAERRGGLTEKKARDKRERGGGVWCVVVW